MGGVLDKSIEELAEERVKEKAEKVEPEKPAEPTTPTPASEPEKKEP